MRPFRHLRFKDKRHGAPSDLLRRTLVPSLCHLGPISGHLSDTRVCSPTVEKHVLLQGSNSCKLSVCPLQLKEKVPWTTQATEIRKVLLTLTKAECRYMLCGMIMAPTMATACMICGVWQSEQDGRNMPLRIWVWLGFTVTYYTQTEQLLAFIGTWD